MTVAAGGDNNLAIIIQSSSFPNVQCDPGPAPPIAYATFVMNGMPATTGDELFGPANQPGVTIGLPTGYRSSK